MKNLKQTILLLMVAFAFSINAQTIGEYVDVLHFKNGTSIKGVIVEQVPGKTVKVKAEDGQEYVYSITEISRFTRELSADYDANSKTTAEGKCCSSKKGFDFKSEWMSDYKAKENGYFFEANLLASTNASAFRVLNGYRFGRMGNIGLAIGIENIATARKSMSSVPEATLNLVYFGELHDRKVTPFFQIEGGYGVALKRTANEMDYNFFNKDNDVEDTDVTSALYFGGPMSGLVLGLKIRTKKKVSFKLGLDARLVSQFSKKTHTIVYEDASTRNYTKDDFEVFPGIGARFGIGF